MPKAAADWHKVAEEYITGDDAVTHLLLAKKHSVSPETVSRHAAVEKWMARRNDYRQAIATQSLEKAVNKIANERANQIAVNRKALQLAQARLIEAIQERDKDGNPVLKANSLDSATRAMVEVIRGIEFVDGEPDSRQEVNLNGSARDKLAERLESYIAQQGDAGDDGGPD